MGFYSWRENTFLFLWGLYFTLVLFLYGRGIQLKPLFLMFLLAMVLRLRDRSPRIAGGHSKAAAWGLTFYLLVSLISTLVPNEALNLPFSGRDSTPFYGALIIVSVYLTARSPRMIRHLILILVAVFGIYFGVELAVTPWWDSLSAGSRFAGSMSVHPNTLGMTLLTLPSLCLGSLGIVRGRAGKTALVAGAVVFTFLLLFTKSRSCLLVLGLVNVPLSVLIYCRSWQWKYRIMVAAVIIVMIVPLASYFWMDHASEDRNSRHGIYGRLEAWQISTVLAVDGPWYRTLIGHGKYKRGYRQLVDHYGRHSRRYPGEPVHAHSSYFQVLVESGMLGLTGLLLFFGSLLHGLLSLYRDAEGDPTVPGILLVLLCTILAMGVLDNNLNSLAGKLNYGIIAMAAATIGLKTTQRGSCKQ